MTMLELLENLFRHDEGEDNFKVSPLYRFIWHLKFHRRVAMNMKRGKIKFLGRCKQHSRGNIKENGTSNFQDLPKSNYVTSSHVDNPKKKIPRNPNLW